MNKRITSAAGLVAWLPAAAAAAGVMIELRSEVPAIGATVTLGQLARLQSPDLALMRRLVDLPIGRAPAQGASVVVQREALAAWLDRRLGLTPIEVEWNGPETSRVSASTRTVAGEEIAAAAAQALQDWLAAHGTRGETHLAVAPRDIEAPQGPLRLHVRALGHAVVRTRVTVWVEVWVGERFARVVPVTFGIETWGDGIVAMVAEPAMKDAVRTRRAAAAGAPPRPQEMKPLPAVVRGQWASLHSGTGVVRSESRVEVLQDGRVGDKVRVRPTAATASLVVRVSGPGLLEVAP